MLQQLAMVHFRQTLVWVVLSELDSKRQFVSLTNCQNCFIQHLLWASSEAIRVCIQHFLCFLKNIVVATLDVQGWSKILTNCFVKQSFYLKWPSYSNRTIHTCVIFFSDDSCPRCKGQFVSLINWQHFYQNCFIQHLL